MHDQPHGSPRSEVDATSRTWLPFSTRTLSHSFTSAACLANSFTCASSSLFHPLTISSIVLPLSRLGTGSDAEEAPAAGTGVLLPAVGRVDPSAVAPAVGVGMEAKPPVLSDWLVVAGAVEARGVAVLAGLAPKREVAAGLEVGRSVRIDSDVEMRRAKATHSAGLAPKRLPAVGAGVVEAAADSVGFAPKRPPGAGVAVAGLVRSEGQTYCSHSAERGLPWRETASVLTRRASRQRDHQ